MLTLMKLWFGKVYDFLLPTIRFFMSTAGTVLAQAAMAAVTQVASQYVLEPDAEKRQAAFDIIKQELVKQGIVATASAINLAIEVAVAKSKTAQP